MASIARDKNGTRRIIFIAPDGKRPTIRLGKISQRAAESIKYRVEQLLEALNLNRPMEADLAHWVTDLEPWLAKKLARVGLIPNPEAKPAQMLGAFLEAYFARRQAVKPATSKNWGHARRNLLAFFGPDKLLREVTVAEARDFEPFLKTTARENRYSGSKRDEPLATATVPKRISNAKLFFGDALERGLIDSNPFAKLKGASVSNAARQFFITHDMTAKVLDACPDSQWRLVVALCRYGGLRCPSELVRLQLADVDWDAGRVRVTSPKTAHHEGKGERFIPLFPELRPYLEAVWCEAPEGATHFITRYRDPAQNLRTTFQKIIHRAGLKPWPKLFQNLRSSRQTELEESYPSHVVCAWMGNSWTVAQKNYLQVTDEHFAKAAQNPAQSAHATERTEPQAAMAAHEQTPVLPGLASGRDYLPLRPVGVTGLEPADKTREKASSADWRARCATIQPPSDPDLRLIVERWGELPESTKAGILAMVRAADSPPVQVCPSSSDRQMEVPT